MKITRRVFAFFLVLAVPLLLFSRAHSSKKSAARGQYLVYVGTYTTKTESKGIYAYEFDSATGKLTPKGVAAETPDPSWVAVHPSGKFLYAANEAGKASTVSAFAIDAKNGKLTILNQMPALGEDPCYLSFDKTGKYLLVANYTSGNVVVFPIGADGKLGAATANVRDEGKRGPNKERQEASHAHWVKVSARDNFAAVADLGLDRVLFYKFDASRGALTPGAVLTANSKADDPSSALLRPGTGPRHLAFSRMGPFMYVLGELNSTVTVFSYDARGTYRPIQSLSTLPAGFSGRNDAAEIAVPPNGKFLYTSNRGHDSIAVFAIHPAKGTLTFVAHVLTGGEGTRHFSIDLSWKYLFWEKLFLNKIVGFKYL